MSIVIDANMRLFADRMNITSSRMVQDYGLKTVEEIIEAEAEKGNMRAVSYAADVFRSPEQLMKVFRLADPDNKYVILSKLDDRTRSQILPLLEQEDLVMGLYFFTQEKLLAMLENVDITELVNVILEAFPLEDIISKFKEEDLAKFFQNDKLEKYDVINELYSLPPDVMQKFIEGVTGQPSDKTNPHELIKSIEALPDDKFRDFMSAIDPDVQRQLTFQLTKKKPEYLQLFDSKAYLDMLNKLMKPDMIKPMIALEKETLINMNMELSDDLMSIVCTQVDTKRFADFLINGHLDILKEALMV